MWSALGDSCRISECWGLSEVSLGQKVQKLAEPQKCLLCGIKWKFLALALALTLCGIFS